MAKPKNGVAMPNLGIRVPAEVKAAAEEDTDGARAALVTWNYKTKCANCGKAKGDHLAGIMSCPVGCKNRVHGYSTYHKCQTFQPKQPKGTAKGKGQL